MLNESLFAVDIWPEIALRLGLATAIGMAVGWEREVKDYPAGIRTHGLIALSAATITVIAMLLFYQLRGPDTQMDPLRVIEGMATAAGFVGGGLIVIRGGDVKNITTAAHIWMTATLGIACGAGQYVLVGIASALAIFLLVAVQMLKPGKSDGT